MAHPVEYAVAVDKYLDAAALGDASRRVYRIALDGAGTAERLRRFQQSREPRTANRELSILRSAVAWWAAR
jgi:hypothetical protein